MEEPWKGVDFYGDGRRHSKDAALGAKGHCLSGQDNFPKRARFALNIPHDVLLSYYEGTARAVMVKSMDGRSIQFPANILRRFVTDEGVQGIFEMEFDENNRFVDMRRVGD